jgi:hypothetical protein
MSSGVEAIRSRSIKELFGMMNDVVIFRAHSAGAARLFKFCRLACALVAFSGPQVALAQKPEPADVTEPPREISALLSSARITAPELAADTLLKVSKSKQVTDSEWRREILEEAYRMAGDARNPVKKKSIPLKGVPVDTHAGYLSYAYDLELDTLSLRSRVIRQMLALDIARSRQMLFEINGRLGLQGLKCEEGLVYEVSDIYGAVVAVANAAFSGIEIEEGMRALFIAPWFENIESPSQIDPALDLLTEFWGIPIERQILTTALSRAITRNFNDDRSFTYAAERDGLNSKIYRLTTGTDDPSKAHLRSAYREFLIKNLQAPRCKDNEIAHEEQLPPFLATANRMFEDKPIKYEDIETSELLGIPNVVHYWQSANSKRLSRELRALELDTEGRTATDEEKERDEWQGRVRTLLDNLDSWSAEGNETQSEVFNQKCVLYRTLVARVPAGRTKTDVFRSYMRFLHSAPMQKENFIEWFLHVRHLAGNEPRLFDDLTSEFPNPHFRLIVELRTENDKISERM